MNGGPSTRDQILRAAVRHFAAQGYARTGLDEIARDAGITKPAIYHYFESKEKLFLTILEETERVHERILAEVMATQLRFPDMIVEAYRRVIRFLREDPDMGRLMVQIQHYSSELKPFLDLRTIHREQLAAFSRAFKAVTTGWRLRPGIDLVAVAEYFRWAFYSFMARCLFLEEYPEDDETLRRLCDMLLFGAFERPE